MGSKHSKAHPRVTRVAPMQDEDPMSSPASPVDLVFNDNPEDQSSYSFARLQEKRALDRQLPPLRGTLYGRYSSGLEVPRPMSVDIPLEKGETSIIKRHPPRRFQLLEPLEPQVLIAEKFLTQKEAETTQKKKQELEKRVQALTYSSGKRQYLHKMKMLEMNHRKQEAQAELKRSLHREARINKHKMRELKAKNIPENIPRNDGSEDFVTIEPDVPINGETGNAWNREFVKYHEQSEYHPRKSGELRRWSLKQQIQDELFWDSSSTDSDESGKEERKSWTLVRTKTERIALFDEFFDQE